jgi:hypothetical protein
LWHVDPLLWNDPADTFPWRWILEINPLRGYMSMDTGNGWSTGYITGNTDRVIVLTLARTSSNCKRQTHPLVKEDVTLGLWLQVFIWKQNIAGRESQGVWHQDELIGGKPPVVK